METLMNRYFVCWLVHESIIWPVCVLRIGHSKGFSAWYMRPEISVLMFSLFFPSSRIRDSHRAHMVMI